MIELKQTATLFKITIFLARVTLSHVTTTEFVLMMMVKLHVNVNLDSLDWTVPQIRVTISGLF